MRDQHRILCLTETSPLLPLRNDTWPCGLLWARPSESEARVTGLIAGLRSLPVLLEDMEMPPLPVPLDIWQEPKTSLLFSTSEIWGLFVMPAYCVLTATHTVPDTVPGSEETAASGLSPVASRILKMGDSS